MYLTYVCSIMPIGGDASKHLIHMYMTWVNACLMILVLVEYGFFCLIPNTFPTNLCHSFEFLCSDLGFSCGTFPFAVQAYVQHKVPPIKVVSVSHPPPGHSLELHFGDLTSHRTLPTSYPSGLSVKTFSILFRSFQYQFHTCFNSIRWPPLS